MGAAAGAAGAAAGIAAGAAAGTGAGAAGIASGIVAAGTTGVIPPYWLTGRLAAGDGGAGIYGVPTCGDCASGMAPGANMLFRSAVDGGGVRAAGEMFCGGGIPCCGGGGVRLIAVRYAGCTVAAMAGAGVFGASGERGGIDGVANGDCGMRCVASILALGSCMPSGPRVDRR